MSQGDSIVGLGARSDFVAPAPNADPVRLRLNPEEVALLQAVGRASRIGDLIQASGHGEAKAIALLLALRAKGAIVPARVNKPEGPAAPIDASLNEEVDLDPERKREILEIEGKLERANHYEILGLSPGASPDEVKSAFYEASRKFHPDRYFKKNLGSFRARIERIFKRVAEAHHVLYDDERRAVYLKAHPELAAAPRGGAAATPAAEAPRQRTAEDDARDAERRARFARHPYLLKTNRMSEMLQRARAHVTKGEFGMAFSDLNIALQFEPRNQELQQLLADTRKKHDALRSEQEMERAKALEEGGDFAGASGAYRNAAMLDVSNPRAAYKAAQLLYKTGQDPKELKVLAQRAAELDPRNADYHVLFGIVLMDAGMKKLADKQFEEALKINPNHAEAKKHAKKSIWPF